MSECPVKTRIFPLLQELVDDVGQYEERQVQGFVAGARVVAQDTVAEAPVARSLDLTAAFFVFLVGASPLRVSFAQYAGPDGVTRSARTEDPLRSLGSWNVAVAEEAPGPLDCRHRQQ